MIAGTCNLTLLQLLPLLLLLLAHVGTLEEVLCALGRSLRGLGAIAGRFLGRECTWLLDSRLRVLGQVAWFVLADRAELGVVGLVLRERLLVGVRLADDAVLFVGVGGGLTADELLFGASQDLADVLRFNFLLGQLVRSLVRKQRSLESATERHLLAQRLGGHEALLRAEVGQAIDLVMLPLSLDLLHPVLVVLEVGRGQILLVESHGRLLGLRGRLAACRRDDVGAASADQGRVVVRFQLAHLAHSVDRLLACACRLLISGEPLLGLWLDLRAVKILCVVPISCHRRLRVLQEEGVRVPLHVLRRVAAELLPLAGHLHAHPLLELVACQVELGDELRVRHQALHALVYLGGLLLLALTLASALQNGALLLEGVLLLVEVVVDEHAHLLELLALLRGVADGSAPAGLLLEEVEVDVPGRLVRGRQIHSRHVLLREVNQLAIIGREQHQCRLISLLLALIA